MKIIDKIRPKTINIAYTKPGEIVVSEEGTVYLRINAAKFTGCPVGYVHFVDVLTGEMYHSNSLPVYVGNAKLEIS